MRWVEIPEFDQDSARARTNADVSSRVFISAIFHEMDVVRSLKVLLHRQRRLFRQHYW